MQNQHVLWTAGIGEGIAYQPCTILRACALVLNLLIGSIVRRDLAMQLRARSMRQRACHLYFRNSATYRLVCADFELSNEITVVMGGCT